MMTEPRYVNLTPLFCHSSSSLLMLTVVFQISIVRPRKPADQQTLIYAKALWATSAILNEQPVECQLLNMST
jgi:hypothetical protein